MVRRRSRSGPNPARWMACRRSKAAGAPGRETTDAQRDLDQGKVEQRKDEWVMEVEQLFQDFQYQDLRWFIPVLAGLVIIVGGILVALIRNFTAGVIVALLFGGLMTMSPVLLDTLQRQQQDPVARVAAGVARNAAELAVLNSEVMRDLSRVVISMRSTLDGLTPMIAPADRDPPDVAVARRFTQSLSDMEPRIEAATATIARADALRTALQQDIQVLEVEIRRAGAR